MGGLGWAGGSQVENWALDHTAFSFPVTTSPPHQYPPNGQLFQPDPTLHPTHSLLPSSILLLPGSPNLVTSTVKTFTFPVTTSPLHHYPLSGPDCNLLPTPHSSFTHQHFLPPSRILLLPGAPNFVNSTVKTFTFPVTTSPLHHYLIPRPGLLPDPNPHTSL